MEMQRVMQKKKKEEEAWSKSDPPHATTGAESYVCLTKDFFGERKEFCKPGQHLKSTKSSSSLEWNSPGNKSKNMLTCFFDELCEPQNMVLYSYQFPRDRAA